MSASLRNQTSVVEKMDVVGFSYTRREFQSPILGKTVKLGALTPASATNGAPIRGTVYILHGGIGDDRFTMDVALAEAFSDELLQRLLSLRIQIVMPFIGRSFLHNAYSDYFRDEVIPIAEEGTQTKDTTRYLTGYSMGGQAALNYFLRNARSFSGAAAMFPTLIDFDYTSEKEIAAFSARTGVTGEQLAEVLREFNDEFTDRTDFAAHDPMSLFAAIDAKQLIGKRLFFGAGEHDDYGLFEGCRKLHVLLEKRGIAHLYDEFKGGKHDLEVLKSGFPKMIQGLIA